jgi:hypothetical protein
VPEPALPEPDPDPDVAVDEDPEPIIFAPEEQPRQRARKKSSVAATSMVRENSYLDHEMGSAEMGSAEVLGSIANMKASHEARR